LSIIAANPLAGGKSVAELSQTVQHRVGARQAMNPQNIMPTDQVDPITFHQPKLSDQLYRQAHRQGVAPSHDFHPDLLRPQTPRKLHPHERQRKLGQRGPLWLCLLYAQTLDVEKACANLVGQAIVSKNNARSHKNRAHGSSGA
jgi:hypothetical protein